MSTLVTGGAGYIGSHMVLALLDAGEPVVVVDDLSTGLRSAVPQGIEFYVGDCGDQALIEHVINEHSVDAVAHFAASVIVAESVKDPLGYYLNNTAKARSLIESTVRCGVMQFLFSSTCAVYGQTDGGLISENTTPRPVSPYGRSKLMVEWMLEDAGHAYGLRSVVLRYFNVAGADPQGRAGQSSRNATHLIKVAVQAAVGLRSQVEIFGDDYPTSDGTCLRDYIQVTDLVDAHIDGLRYLRHNGVSLTCNVGYDRGYTVKEVIAAVGRVSGVEINFVNAARRAGDPAAVVACSSRIRSNLAWKPRYDDLSTIIEQALMWEQKQIEPSQEKVLR